MAFNSGQITIEGIDELSRHIKNLPSDKVKRKELLKALRRQAKPLLEAVKEKAPVANNPITVKGVTYQAGNLQKSFNIKAGRSKTMPNVVVGPRRGKKNKYDGWYAHFLLYGTDHIQGKDFVKEAADEKLPIISVTASKELLKYIVKKTKQIPFIK